MIYRNLIGRLTASLAVSAALLFIAAPLYLSQARGGGQRGGPPPTARASAPFDITGWWVSLVTDDWEYRMVTPSKGRVDFLPANQAGRAVADAWDPAKDEAAGEQCKGYGAAGIMKQPTRMHITWENDNSLKVELDTGTQTRMFNFGGAAQAGGATTQAQRPAPSWQGTSVAQWELQGARGGAAATGPVRGALNVVTTNMRPGYLRKNGVPYSANAVLTEWFNILEDRGTQYLAIQVQVVDPTYLTGPFFRTVQFKREPDGSKWNPTPCSAR
jgi:hypothetical protein